MRSIVRAVADMRASKWLRLVDQHFAFLRAEFACEVVETSDKDPWATTVIYQNTTIAVEVDYSVEFDRAEVLLVRLVDGARPTYPVFVSEQPALHHFLLDSLLEVRAPELLKTTGRLHGLRAAEVDAQLSAWAHALKQHGSDVLSGDFGIFAQLEAVVRERVRRNPEQIIVWSPAGETDPDLERVRSAYPTIPIVQREYAVPPRSDAKRANRSKKPKPPA